MKELAFEDCRADPSRDGGFLCLQQVVRKKSILLANIHCILAFRVMGDRSRGLLRFGPREKAISMTDTQNKATAFVFLDKINKRRQGTYFLSAIASVYPILPLSGISPAWVDR